jgi:alpha-mannosidase
LLVPHSSELRVSTLSRISEQLNKPLAVHSESGHSGNLPMKHSLIALDSDDVSIGAIKTAEDGNGIIIRAVELEGNEARLHLEGVLGPHSESLDPYAIQTFRLQHGSLSRVDFLERPL